eukprot:scaffold185241_cov31-Tisochrysis_lutea.AAC.1
MTLALLPLSSVRPAREWRRTHEPRGKKRVAADSVDMCVWGGDARQERRRGGEERGGGGRGERRKRRAESVSEDDVCGRERER